MNDEIVEVASAEELRGLLGEVAPRVANKARGSLGELHRRWIEASPFCLVATASADGHIDISPKGDPAGSVLVVDEGTLVVPERPGNRRADGFHNVLANPRAALLFVIPGRGDTLRVSGSARVLRDAPFFDDLVCKGHRPTLALMVNIESVFFHCSKAFLRSGLWKPASWAPQSVPSRAHIAQALERPDESIEELERYYGPAYAAKLYK